MGNRKTFLAMILSLLVSGICYSDIKIGVVNGSDKIRPETKIAFEDFPEIRLFSAKSEYESFQIVLENTCDEDFDFKFTISDLFLDAGNIIKNSNIKAYSVEYIDVARFSRDTGKWPDPLIEVTGSRLHLDRKSRFVLWFNVFVPEYTEEGTYKGNLAIEIGGKRFKNIEIELNVWNFCLPRTPTLRTAFALWPGFIAKRYKLSLDSEALKDMVETYWKNMFEHRVSNLNYVCPSIEEVRGNAEMDFADFDEKMEYYVRNGINSFNVFWSGIPYTYGEQKPSEIPADFAKYLFVKQVLQGTEQHLKDKRWLSKGYIYLADEPDVKYFSVLKKTLSEINKLAPEIKRLVTIGYATSKPDNKNNYGYMDLSGYVDVWVVHTDKINQQFLEERRQEGDEVWWYVTCGTRRPYANFWAIDYTAAENRILFWQMFKNGAQGTLYWCINYWEKDVWKDPVSYADCNGEGSLVYWGADGPVNSVRWEIIRDGIEDYDYLFILAEKIAELKKGDTGGEYSDLISEAVKLCDVSDLVPSLTEYTRNYLLLLNRREEIGNMISKITCILKEKGN
ncbi:MAG: DUF4091 domain-containing protein [Candidatus Aureabacteria bacterium]|nr:DUF4091 domain-containing protein [Candidatus Auribacterota bacterium]